MSNIQSWGDRHRRSLMFLVVLATFAGLMLSFKLPVTLFPKIDFPRVMVSLEAGDQPIEQMVLQVTTPVEEAVRQVPGVRGVRSTSSRGAAEVSITFDWGVDMAVAALQINSTIAPLLGGFPIGTKLDVRRMDATVFPIIAYSLTSTTTPLTDVHDLAKYSLVPLLTAINGVARVAVIDNAVSEVRVITDPIKLQAYGLTLDDISKALSNLNTLSIVGRVEEHYKLSLILIESQINDTAAIENAVIKRSGNGLIHLRDVARISREISPQWLRVNADGKEAVLLQIYQQPGSNSVQISSDVQATLDTYSKQLPADVKLANWYDQSELVVTSAASVRDAILIGIVLAGIILWLFLRNINITLIAVVMVPIVLAVTVVILRILDMSFNIMTLGGMAAAVGLIVDDAIVMLEHIVRRHEEQPKTSDNERPRHSALDSAAEFSRPLIGSSGATIIIFIPLAFLSGVTGAFFKALSLTMASSLLISFLVTWLVIPILADWLISYKNSHKRREKIHNQPRFSDGYKSLMKRLFNRPALLLLGIIPLFLVGILAYYKVGTGFIPSMDEGGFVLDYRAEPGTSLAETNRLLNQVETILRKVPEVDTYSRRTGVQLGGGLTEANEGDFFIRLKPLPRRPLDDVMDDIRTRIEQQVPGLELELVKLMEDLIGDLTAVPQPVEIKIFSDNPEQLISQSHKITNAIAGVSGLVDLNNGIHPAGDALDLHIDPATAALQGMDVASIAQAAQNALSGVVATQIIHPAKLEDVRVWIPLAMRQKQQNIETLMIRAPDGHVFPLSRVAKAEVISGQPQVTRENLQRMVAVTGRITGRDTGSVMRDVKKILNKPGMFPKGSYYKVGGLYHEQQIAFKGLIIVFAAAVALVFCLLLFLYERFVVALSIMAMPLLSVAAVFSGLWITGAELNISAMMGMTMIVGIVTEVSIFYFSEYEELRNVHKDSDALTQAGVNRARPIIMTTLTAILTLLPLAFALGQGSAMQQPLAIAIVSGLLIQLPLVLIVMPVLYQLLQKFGDRLALFISRETHHTE